MSIDKNGKDRFASYSIPWEGNEQRLDAVGEGDQRPRKHHCEFPDEGGSTHRHSLWLPHLPVTFSRFFSRSDGNERRANMVERQGCGMDYVTFPFDTVTCDFVIGTWLPDSFIRVTATRYMTL